MVPFCTFLSLVTPSSHPFSPHPPKPCNPHLSEHSPRMELCEENSECLSENSKKTSQEPCDLSFLKSWNCFGMFLSSFQV